MASLPHQTSLALIGPYTSTNKNTITPCINAQLNKKRHFSNLVAKPKLWSPIAVVGQKKPIMRDIIRGEQFQNEKWKAPRCSDDNGSSGVAPDPDADVLSLQESLVQDFYKAFNDKDAQALEQLLSPRHCAYYDFLFYGPYETKESVLNFLNSAMDALGPNVHVHVEIRENNHLATTVLGHLEWKTKKMPFTSGCRIFEFEEVDGRLFISKITGLEELPVKPGELVLKLLKAVRTVFDNYPLAAEAMLESHSSQDNTHGGIDTHLDLFGRGH